MDLIDKTVRAALTEFASDELDGSWSGKREREAVSLFSFGALLNQVEPDGPLNDPRQVGLEVPIPQVTLDGEVSDRKKDQVCKDIVIWPKPRMTCWDRSNNPTTPPAAVIEWKFDRSSIYSDDVEWLEAFTGEYSDCVGYAVTANQPSSTFTLSCTRVANHQKQSEWIHMS